jgi:hypothetical protein
MDTPNQELHPIYGAIQYDGEFVQQGEILGLSVDAREVVTAPISGWIQLLPDKDSDSARLFVHIRRAVADSRSSTETAA